MLISHKLKLIFIHIQKTGGASFKQAIRDIDPKAQEIIDFHAKITRELINKYPDYYKVTIVRNSYKIVVSRWKFGGIKYGHLTETQVREFWRFKEWLLNSLGEVFNQVSYIKDEKGMLVDQIIYYDKLEEGIKKLNKKLNINISMKNKKVHYYGLYNYKEFYNKEIKQIVEKKCKEDIKYFNWKFED